MNSGELRDIVPELSDRLTELERERRRLAELTTAYRVVERSKFAQLRLLAADTRALLGRGLESRKIVRSATTASEAASTRANGSVPVKAFGAVVERLIDEVTLARAAQLDTKDALEAERSRSGSDDPYRLWMLKFGTRDIDLARMRELVPLLPRRPVISILVPTYNTPERYLRAAIESVRAQVYPDWELCIADDASPDSAVRRVLAEYAELDARIKVTFRKENGHIARATNSALESATGEFVAFLDHDDELTPDALFECALLVNRYPDLDMVYSDEDKIDDAGAIADPFFKPDWNPERFLSQMYTCHFAAYRRALVEELGGLRPEFDGSQDYDLVLRLSERTTRIHHIPKVLYHWRIHSASVTSGAEAKPYAYQAAERAIAEALERRGEPGRVSGVPGYLGHYMVRYDIRERKKVSVIVPTRNHGADVDRCLESIFSKTTYKDFEIVLLDNGSDEPDSLRRFARWPKRDRRVKVVRYDVPFNYSRINNYAVEHSDGHYVLLLNNDTEVITADWMEAMVEQAQRPAIGAVGGLLLYPDGSIQHAGIVTGLGGVAAHSHRGFPGDSPGYVGALLTISNFSAITGACLMVRRAVWDEVGGLDEEFAVAYNDVDFGLRVCEAGYRNVFLPHVKLYHFESKSRGLETTPEKIHRFDKEKQLMRERWKTDSATDPCYNRNLTVDREDFSIRTR